MESWWSTAISKFATSLTKFCAIGRTLFSYSFSMKCTLYALLQTYLLPSSLSSISSISQGYARRTNIRITKDKWEPFRKSEERGCAGAYVLPQFSNMKNMCCWGSQLESRLKPNSASVIKNEMILQNTLHLSIFAKYASIKENSKIGVKKWSLQ